MQLEANKLNPFSLQKRRCEDNKTRTFFILSCSFAQQKRDLRQKGTQNENTHSAAMTHQLCTTSKWRWILRIILTVYPQVKHEGSPTQPFPLMLLVTCMYVYWDHCFWTTDTLSDSVLLACGLSWVYDLCVSISDRVSPLLTFLLRLAHEHCWRRQREREWKSDRERERDGERDRERERSAAQCSELHCRPLCWGNRAVW